MNIFGFEVMERKIGNNMMEIVNGILIKFDKILDRCLNKKKRKNSKGWKKLGSESEKKD